MFSGVYTALVTPFNNNREIDWNALENLVKDQLAQGISGLVPVGTTGESPTLSHDENMEVVARVIEMADGKVPVIAGTGSNCTAEAIRMTKRAKEAGATASLQVAPYYNKPNQEGLYRHFMTIAEEVDLPMVVYNIKGRSGINIETPTLLRMADHQNIVSVKEASGDFDQMLEVLECRPEGFSVLSGDDSICIPLTLMGGDGVISVASNIIPTTMEEAIKIARDGKAKEASQLHYALAPLFGALAMDTNPIPVKGAMAMMGMIEEEYRLPLCPLNSEQKNRMRDILKSQGLI